VPRTSDYSRHIAGAIPPEILNLHLPEVCQSWEIWPVDSQEHYWSCCHQMSDCKAKMRQIRFRQQTPPGELTAPRPIAAFKGPTSRGNEGGSRHGLWPMAFMRLNHDNVCACAVSSLILLPIVNPSLEMDPSATSVSYNKNKKLSYRRDSARCRWGIDEPWKSHSRSLKVIRCCANWRSNGQHYDFLLALSSNK